MWRHNVLLVQKIKLDQVGRLSSSVSWRVCGLPLKFPNIYNKLIFDLVPLMSWRSLLGPYLYYDPYYGTHPAWFNLPRASPRRYGLRRSLDYALHKPPRRNKTITSFYWNILNYQKLNIFCINFRQEKGCHCADVVNFYIHTVTANATATPKSISTATRDHATDNHSFSAIL